MGTREGISERESMQVRGRQNLYLQAENVYLYLRKVVCSQLQDCLPLYLILYCRVQYTHVRVNTNTQHTRIDAPHAHTRTHNIQWIFTFVQVIILVPITI